jgi:hypothetical protein
MPFFQSADKRVKTRFPVKIPVLVRLEQDGVVVRGVRNWKNEKVDAVAVDLSLTGMQIEMEKPLEVGYLSQFELVFGPGTAPLSLFAKVVWTTPKGAGLQFLIMNEKQKSALSAFLNRMTVQPADVQAR